MNMLMCQPSTLETAFKLPLELKHPYCYRAKETTSCMPFKNMRCACSLALNTFHELGQSVITLQLKSRGTVHIYAVT